MGQMIREAVRKSEIDKRITELKLTNVSARKISEVLEKEFAINISHQSVQAYWKSDLNGVAIDMQNAKIKKTLNPISDDPLGLEEIQPTYCEDTFKKQMEIHELDGVGGELYSMYSALAVGNAKDHRDKGIRLRVEYIKAMKEAKNLFEKTPE